MTETATLAAALAALQSHLPEIRKNKTAEVKNNRGELLYSYAYADLAGVSAEVLPLMGSLGLSFMARPTLTSDGKFVLAYSLIHSSGEREDGEYPLPSGGNPQSIGMAITYGRRYILSAITGAVAEEDDDAAALAMQAKDSGPVRRRALPGQPAGRMASRRVEGAAGAKVPAAPQPPGLPPLPGEEEFDVPAEVVPGGDEAADPGAAGPPSAAGSPGPAADPPSAAGSVTRAQLTKLGAIFTEYGFTREERDQRLTTAEMITGRELTGPAEGRTSANLSRHEASALIDTLEQIGGRDKLTEHLAQFAASRDQEQ